MLKNGTPDTKDKILWKGLRGAATTKAEFGDPLTTDSYAFCLYDNTGLQVEATVAPGGTCGGRPCWSEKVFSYTYKDKALSQGGTFSIFLKQGLIDGLAKFVVKVNGANITTMPSLDTLQSPVTVQLKNSQGICWGAVYTFPPASKNDAGMFKDKFD